MSDQQPVKFEYISVANSDKNIAIATLQMEKSLNSLNLQMIHLLNEKLSQWQQDDTIVCVFLQGSGDKAFCAGGDVVALYNASASYGQDLPNNDAETFFTHEYQLDHTIHTYTKPIICWGHGIVMGGGLGLMSGASHRVVTETTRMAMPEVTIGLFPDVGGTWFLNRTPGRTGLFLGLTGAPFNGADAKFLGVADRFIPNSERSAVLQALTESCWGDANSHFALIGEVLRGFEKQHINQQPEEQVRTHLDLINDLCDAETTVDIVERISAYDGDDKWLNKAVQGLVGGCPMTQFLVVEQLKRGKHLSLAEVFRQDLIMAVNCAAKGHFREGVRALLIDKDREPKWTPGHIAEVPEKDVASFFDAPWDVHPLSNL